MSFCGVPKCLRLTVTRDPLYTSKGLLETQHPSGQKRGGIQLLSVTHCAAPRPATSHGARLCHGTPRQDNTVAFAPALLRTVNTSSSWGGASSLESCVGLLQGTRSPGETFFEEVTQLPSIIVAVMLSYAPCAPDRVLGYAVRLASDRLVGNETEQRLPSADPHPVPPGVGT